MKKENEAVQNPSYNKDLSIEERLRDFLGKYYINLNGVVPNNYPEITQINKQEIIDFVVLISKDTHKDCIKKSEVEKFVSQRKTDGQVSYRLGYNEALDDLSNIIK